MSENYFIKLSKLFLYLVPFSVVIVYQGTLFPFIVGKYVFFRTVVDLALVFFVLGWAFSKNFQFSIFNFQLWKQPLVITVAIFTLIFILAGFLGVNPAASFWSNFERGEGVFQLIHLFIFFILLVLLFTDEKSWRRMFVVAVWVAVLVIAYGLAAAMDIGNFVGSNLCARFAGSLGNPAYTGTFLIFAIFYSLYLFGEDLKTKKKWLWFSLAVLFFVLLLFTQTRGALLGLGVATIVGLFYLFFALPKGKFKIISLAAAVLLIGLGILGYNFRRSINIMPFCKEETGGNRILDVNFGTETFQTRLLLWKESVEAFKERPVLGWGPENFTVAFEKYYKPQFTTWYDRAHNIFFDYLVMTGGLGLLSFLGIFIVYYWRFFKTRTYADFDGTRTMADNDSKLLYEDITYKIRGAIFDVKKQLGLGHKEFIYQNALEEEFNKRGIIFEREKPLDIMYNNKKVGIYKPDFIIENKIILELKSLPFLGKNEKKQIWHYLRGLPYQLALLVNFGQKNDIQIERIIYAPDLLSRSAKSAKSAKSVLSPFGSALIFSLPIAYLVQGLVLFDVLPIYINLFLFLAFATYKFKIQNSPPAKAC